MAEKEKIEECKKVRRNRKGQLTRTLNVLTSICEKDEVMSESIRDLLKKAEQQYTCIEEAHDALVELLSDEDFDKEEKRMLEWQAQFVEEKEKALKKLKELEKQEKPSDPTPGNQSSAQSSKMEEFKLALELPKAEIPQFHGDPTKFWSFIKNFQVNVAEKLSSDEARLSYLIQLTGGKARSSIECCILIGDKGYEKAKEILKTQFGQPHVILHALMDEMLTCRVGGNNAESLWKLISMMKKCQITLEQMGYEGNLNNPENLLKIQKLLPYNLQRKWASKAQEVMIKGAEPKFQDMVKYLEGEAGALNNVFGRSLRAAQNTNRSNTFLTNPRPSGPQDLCPQCNGSHKLWQCDQFKQMSTDERWGVASEKKLCFKCFGRHQARSCRRQMSCGIEGCPSDHNRMLHKHKLQLGEQQASPQPQAAGNEQGQARTNVNTAATMMSKSKEVALRTVPVTVKHGDKARKVNALLDDGSTQTYINASLATELGLMGTKERMTVEVFNGQTEQIETMPVQLSMRSMDGKTTVRLHAMTTHRVTGRMQATEWCKLKNQWHHLSDIPFEPVSDRETIDLLIGSDYPELHISLDERVGKRNEPVARLTPLGWTCVGRVRHNEGRTYLARTYKCEVGTASDDILKRFWEVENSGLSEGPQYSPGDQEVVKKVADSLYRADGGRYGAKLPWKDGLDIQRRGYNNYDMAFKRLGSLERRLQKDDNLRSAYEDVVQKYVQNGYVSRVQRGEVQNDGKGQCYLPHFPVVRNDKETTKVRVVFDASAKDGRESSLNEMIDVGPKLHRELFDVLLRFRHHKVAVICDIAEMYMQIEIAEEDRSMLRFLWRDPNQSGEADIYQFNRLPFGVNVAPFIAQYVAQHNATLYANDFPLAAETVMKSTYMDDSMDSVPDVETAKELYEQLVALWGKAGMKAHKWITNDREVTEKIPKANRAKEMRLNDQELSSVKALGLCWGAEDDVFIFKEPAGTTPEDSLTKRKVLSRLASVFDPLGFLSPVTMSGKVLMQQMWADGLQWDEAMEGELADNVRKWSEDLRNLDGMTVPRCLRPNNGATELHAFVDASEDAYAAVIYLCCTEENGKSRSTRFVASKTKVAPLKSLSIPRLELMAAVLGVRLTTAVTEALDLEMESVHFWSDSMNVLYWIRNRSRLFKSFVANRIGEIQEMTNPNQWRHVPTKLNPADVASRGATVDELKSNQLWWEGPAFLKESDEKWPSRNMEEPKEREEKRKTTVVGVCNVSFEAVNREERLDPTRFSSWVKMTRVYAYVNRFITNCRIPRADRQGGELTVNELRDIETQIIKRAQQEAFSDELRTLRGKKPLSPTNALSKTNPVIDDDGLLRSSGRLSLNGAIPYNTRYPVILPRKHQVTRLIVKKHHEDGKHVAGTNHTLARLTSKYWLIGGREEIREWETACNECKRRKTKAGQQIMAPLPKSRTNVDTMRAFDKVSVDFAGPFLTKQGRGKTRAKRYLCLFTCMKTRAVHLEIAFGMDTDSFLNCLYRFISRRGNPSEIRSDNGTNFVGARNELVKLDEDEVQRRTSEEGTMWKWNFNPPLAPHFGGIHESLIKSAKRAIYAILGNADVNDEELLSAFVGAEGLMNSRPITYQSASPRDDVPLTPNHFLHGQLGGRFAAETTIDGTSFNPRKRWRRVQELVKHFWKRWLQEYLPTLSPRSKWRRVHRDLQVDDVVLILEKDSARGHWPLGRVIEVFNGPDGHVRVARLKTNKGEVTRPITRLSPLEFTG